MSETKTVDYTSGGHTQVSLVKISARSDKVRGWLMVAQSNALDEKLVLRKTQKKFEKCILLQKKLKFWFLRTVWEQKRIFTIKLDQR